MAGKMIQPIILIMAGGVGERLWPMSRASKPKQLQKIYSNNSLLKETIQRASQITNVENIFIGTNDFLKGEILKKEPSFPKDNFIIEPEAKNTAAIVALATLKFQERFGSERIQIILSADAFINSTPEFVKTIQVALNQAEKDFLVLLGIKPNRPETDYGYIKINKDKLENGSYIVENFYEKPDFEKAKAYIQDESFFWNPGIFIWKNKVILDELKKHAFHIINPIEKDLSLSDNITKSFSQIPSEPIDKAVLEKTDRIKVVPASFIWDDVGSWNSLERISSLDKDSNCHIGSEVFYFNSRGNTSISKKSLVTFLGVENLIVVETEDVTLVSHKDSIGNIKKMLQALKKNKTLQKFTY